MIYVYILHCADDSFYVGMTNNLERRLNEHISKMNSQSYTASRLPVEVVWYEGYFDPNLAIKVEKQIKGWSRKKKEALIRGDFDALVKFSERHKHSRDK